MPAASSLPHLSDAKTRVGLRVLVIDDDEELCQLTAEYLRPLGFHVEAALTGQEGAERATGEAWHAIVLDVMLPDLDGFEVLRRIRAKSTVPVLMLTGRGEEVDRVVGLELGADDYLPKTFSSRELLARLRSAVRRAGWMEGSPTPVPFRTIVAGPLRICPDTHTATLADTALSLTRTEFELLLALAVAKGRVKSRDQLFEELRGSEWEVFDRAIDMHISVLRKKLGDDPKDPRFIKTVRGVGYVLVVSPT
jgi:DNA-binding response OmpR family regulator